MPDRYTLCALTGTAFSIICESPEQRVGGGFELRARLILQCSGSLRFFLIPSLCQSRLSPTLRQTPTFPFSIPFALPHPSILSRSAAPSLSVFGTLPDKSARGVSRVARVRSHRIPFVHCPFSCRQRVHETSLLPLRDNDEYVRTHDRRCTLCCDKKRPTVAFQPLQPTSRFFDSFIGRALLLFSLSFSLSLPFSLLLLPATVQNRTQDPLERGASLSFRRGVASPGNIYTRFNS